MKGLFCSSHYVDRTNECRSSYTVYLTFYARSTVKGHVRAKQNVLLPQVKFCFTLFVTHSTAEDIEIIGSLHPVNHEGHMRIGEENKVEEGIGTAKSR